MSLGMSLEELLEKAVGEEPGLGGDETLSLKSPVEDLFRQGVSLLKEGRALPAAAHFLAVTLLEPGHVKAWNNLGVAYFHLGEYEEALAAFRRVLQLDPQNRQAGSNLALLEKKLSKNSPKRG